MQAAEGRTPPILCDTDTVEATKEDFTFISSTPILVKGKEYVCIAPRYELCKAFAQRGGGDLYAGREESLSVDASLDSQAAVRKREGVVRHAGRGRRRAEQT